MKMVRSNVNQVFYSSLGEPLVVYPRFNVDERMLNSPNAPCLSNGLTLSEQMRRKPDSTICFWRTFALGDILMLTPIFNWLKQEYPACQIYLATSSGFLGVFSYWDLIETVETRYLWRAKYDVGYHLDGVVEQDHQGGPLSLKHRLDIYCEFLGIPVPKEPVFSLPYGEAERSWAKGVISPYREAGKPIVAMQVFGSTDVKRLPMSKVVRIALELSKTCSIIMIHNHKEAGHIEGVLDLSGQTSVHQMTALIDSVDAVVTMDSGILWVAHCTQTPIIALLGPTGEKQRLAYHRNYHLVDLAKMVGCEPCFERRGKCNGAITCMRESDEGRIIEEIRSGVRRLCGS